MHYPSDEMAAATFVDGELADKVKDRMAERPVKVIARFEYDPKRKPLTPTQAIAWANLAMAFNAFIDGDALVIYKTLEDVRKDILADRKSDMWYRKDSEYYIPESKR